MTKHPFLEIIRNRNFMHVWWAGLISVLGNYMLFIALPVYIFNRTDSTLATGLSVMGSALATIVVGQVAGVFVDRWQYKRTVVVANLLLVGVTLGFLFVVNESWWLVIPIAFLQSSIGQVLGPAENAFLPTLVSEDKLATATSLNALNNSLARLVGPALGGLFVTSLGFQGVIMIDAATYFVAALLVLTVKAPEVERERSKVSNSYSLLAEWREGLQAVRSSRSLTLSFVVAGLVGLGEGTISALMAPYVKVMLGGGGLELGYIMSSQAIGGIVGGVVLAGVSHRLNPLRLLGWSALSSGLLLIPLLNYPLVYPKLWPALVLTAVAGFPFVAFSIAQMTLLQSESSAQTRGRVFSSYFALFALTQLVGMLGSGWLGDVLGVLVINTQTVVYLLAGIIVIVAATKRLGAFNV
jgi:MFS family permease